ncbi:hypothetical protein [Acinetobacter haemolyticus]|uniref:hypothetical protein n=1 Tax=Acinetobacter haemolyticus TaxID=29430 RepID=UPI0002D11BF1|nr:hypothetical protein [Acinetobacter haemolyticus]ENW20946.1 hypothetical protein F926_01721 [Acinetobacter haemolyticus NIPH 261]
MKRDQKICNWKQDIDLDWSTSCGVNFELFDVISKPSEHNFKFCCYCGGELVEHEFIEEQSQ